MSPFVIPYYTYRCWEISGFFGPALLYAYFVLSVIITRLVMPWVVKMVIRREKEEGQFRYFSLWLNINDRKGFIIPMPGFQQKKLLFITVKKENE